MDYGITIEDARVERLSDGRSVRTPWQHGWRRGAYERVVRRFWPYLPEVQGAKPGGQTCIWMART